MNYNHNGKEFELTNVQISLINFMESGWTVEESNEPSDWRCRMTREGIKFTVHAPTIRALEEKGIIRQDNAKPVGTYELVE